LIAWGETREAARRRALEALRHFPILGIRTNIPMLVELLEHPRFIAGSIDTRLLDSEAATLAARLSIEPPADVLAIAAAARASGTVTTGHGRGAVRSDLDPWTALRGARV
jgi:geranyl-CoA carboxylase alpha subunit